MSGRSVRILPAGSSHPIKDNRAILRSLQDDMAKLKQDAALIKMDMKIIIAKIEAIKEIKEPIEKGWFG